MSVLPTRVARVGIGTTMVAMCLVAVSAQRPADAPTSVAVYAGVGEELITFGVDVETRDAESGVVPDTSRLRPGGLGLPRRRFPLRRLE